MKKFLFVFIIVCTLLSCSRTDNSFIWGEYHGVLDNAVMKICDYDNGKLGVQISKFGKSSSYVIAKMKLVFTDKDTLVEFTNVLTGSTYHGQYNHYLEKTKIHYDSELGLLVLNGPFTKVFDYSKHKTDEEYMALKAFFKVKLKK